VNARPPSVGDGEAVVGVNDGEAVAGEAVAAEAEGDDVVAVAEGEDVVLIGAGPVAGGVAEQATASAATAHKVATAAGPAVRLI
jgi:hypothetical protein